MKSLLHYWLMLINYIVTGTTSKRLSKQGGGRGERRREGRGRGWCCSGKKHFDHAHLTNFNTQISDFFVSIFNYLFFPYLKMLIHTLQYITRTEKKKNSNWHKWWRENVSGNQRRLGFRVVYCHVQLSGIDIYIKLQERTEEKRLQSLTFLCKNNRKWKVINWNYY